MVMIVLFGAVSAGKRAGSRLYSHHNENLLTIDCKSSAIFDNDAAEAEISSIDANCSSVAADTS